MTGSILDVLGDFQLGNWKIPILGIILLIVSAILLWIIYSYILKKINHKIALQGSTPDVYNGLKFAIRVLIGIIFSVFLIIFLNVQSSYILIISGIFISAIAFASLNGLNNFIAGIWILLVRPFTIGDYININGSEGIVSEISLNYIRIIHVDESVSLIPNVNCLNNHVINYTISKKWLDQYFKRLKLTEEKLKNTVKENRDEFKVLDAIKEEIWQIDETLNMIGNIEENYFNNNNLDKGNHSDQNIHSKYVKKNKMVRYILELNLDKRVHRNEPLFASICEKWKKYFLIKPSWQIYGSDFYIYYRFIILTPDPEFILRYMGDFVKDIYDSVYTQ